MSRIINFLKGMFQVGKTSTKVTKDIIYDARTSANARLPVLFVDNDVIRNTVGIVTKDRNYVYLPDEEENTYEISRLYRRINHKSKIITDVAVITRDYPTTVDFGKLKSDLGKLAVATMSKVMYNTVIQDSLGKPSDKEKRYYLGIGIILGILLGFSISYMFVRSLTG